MFDQPDPRTLQGSKTNYNKKLHIGIESAEITCFGVVSSSRLRQYPPQTSRSRGLWLKFKVHTCCWRKRHQLLLLHTGLRQNLCKERSPALWALLCTVHPSRHADHMVWTYLYNFSNNARHAAPSKSRAIFRPCNNSANVNAIAATAAWRHPPPFLVTLRFHCQGERIDPHIGIMVKTPTPI
jgi:hypothetical protein